MLLTASMLVLAASRAASAAAVNNKGTLAPGLWLNGESIDRSSVSLAATNGQNCDANDDAVECAAKIAQSFQVPASAIGTQSNTTIPLSYSIIPGSIKIPTYVAASECTLSDPTIISKGTLFFCNSESCSQKFTFSSTETNTQTYGYKVGFSVSASGSVVFATVSATASTEWNESWSSSKSTTTTTERDYNLVNGQTCAPTTVQFSVTCKNTLKLADPSVQEWQWTPTVGRGNSMAGIMLSCADATGPMSTAPGSNFTFFQQFCDSIQNGTPIESKMDVAQPGLAGQPWTLEGCMYN